MKPTAILILLLASTYGCVAPVDETSTPDGPDPEQLATDVCAAVIGCVSSIPTVEECADIQLDCRSQLDDPGSWDDHMVACLEIDRAAPNGCVDFIACTQSAPRPVSCQGSRP